MDKEFVPYEQSLSLKGLGFDEPCFGYYEDNNLTITFPSTSENGWKWVGNSIIPAKNTKAPLYQQAFRWFREKYKFDSTIQHNKKYVAIVYSSVENFSIDEYETYEQAELACLKKLIEIVKQKL